MTLPPQQSIIVSGNEILTSIYNDEEEEIIVNQEKISDVPENKRIKLKDKDTIFRFSCALDNDCLRLTLDEIGAFAPYIYRRILNLEEMKQNYKMFRSCDTLIDVQKHILKLFNDNKIELTQDNENIITFNLSVYDVSEPKVIQIDAKRIMTTKKDEALINLYKIQKDQIKMLKQIENYVKNIGPNNNNIIKEIQEKFNQYLH